MEENAEKTGEKIAIITDSCADVPPELAKEYDIYVLPLMITCQDGVYRDGVDIFAEDIYERLKTELPRTSTPTGEEIENTLKTIEEKGYKQAIAIMLSGGLSGTVNHVRIAAEESPLTICVIDSMSGSIGTGAVALQAAIWRDEGLSYSVLCDKVKDLCKGTTVFFSIDTLEYLQKGGRIGKITAMVGTALSIKPILAFDEDGELYACAKVHGHKLVSKKLISLVEDLVNAPENAGKHYNIMVADGGAPKEREELEKTLAETFPDCERLIRAKIGAGLSTYVGPGLLGAAVQFLD